MDCLQARLLLLFARPAEKANVDLGLDGPESSSHDSPSHGLQGHLEQCGECREMARREKAVDEVLGRAMRQVAVPTGLASRILDRVEHARRPSPWTWLAVAACLLLTVGLSLTWYLQPLPPLELAELFPVSANLGANAATVTDWLSQQGMAVEAPQVIDYSYLDSYQMASVQGRRVPKLTFVNQAHGITAVAHVYIISKRDFRWDNDDVIRAVSAGSRNAEWVQAPNQDDFWYLVIYSFGSRENFPRHPSA